MDFRSSKDILLKLHRCNSGGQRKMGIEGKINLKQPNYWKKIESKKNEGRRKKLATNWKKYR